MIQEDIGKGKMRITRFIFELYQRKLLEKNDNIDKSRKSILVLYGF